MAIWQHNKRVLSIFSPRMRRNGYLYTLSKIWPRHSLRRPRCPIRQMHFHYRVTFTGYRLFDVFVLLRRMTILTLTFDLLTLRVLHVQCFSCPTHIPIFIILWLSVTELRVLNIWSHFRYLKQSLRMSRVTWHLPGGQTSPHFWNPWPKTHSLLIFAILHHSLLFVGISKHTIFS